MSKEVDALLDAVFDDPPARSEWKPRSEKMRIVRQRLEFIGEMSTHALARAAGSNVGSIGSSLESAEKGGYVKSRRVYRSGSGAGGTERLWRIS